MPIGQPVYGPPLPNMETGWNSGQTWIDFNPGQCGKCNPHPHPNMCPAVNEICRGCGRKGHCLCVCRTMARTQAMQSQ